MVRVIYDGNLGNWLFQYAFGRILAEKLGYRLDAPPIPGIPGTAEPVDGADYSHQPPHVLRGQKPDLSLLDKAGVRKNLLLTGYFQRAEYYVPHRDRIKGWFDVQDAIRDDVTSDDVVVSMRRGRDYIPHYGLPMSYYDDAMSTFSFGRVFVCTNQPDDPFVKKFSRRYGAVIRPGSFRDAKVDAAYLRGALDNLVFIEKFKKIVMSNSSFAWWAAFLADATQIVGPRPATGMWAKSDPVSRNIDLEVPDPRYLFLECEPYRSISIREEMRHRVAAGIESGKRALRRRLPFVVRMPADSPGQYNFHEDGTRF